MAFELKQLVPSVFTILLLLSTISSHATEQPCKCPGSDQDRRSNYTMVFTGFPFLLVNKYFGVVRKVGLDFARNLTDSDANITRGLSIMDEAIVLSPYRPDGLGIDEAWFSATFVYEPLPNQNRSGLAFLILPHTLEDPEGLSENLGPFDLYNGTSRSAQLSDHYTSVSVEIGIPASCEWLRNTVVVDITIDPFAQARYAVWIDYDRLAGHRLSVYVDVAGKPKPIDTIAEVHLVIGNVTSSFAYAYFGLLSTVAQLLTVRDLGCNVTVEDFTYGYPDHFLSRKRAILFSVLGSVAATLVMATTLACYFNSRYRQWHKDLDQLSKSMERLPGVPTKVEFADIKKATGNFHEAMKLGAGGFGTVYRCTLPATASKTKRPMDVAVKRFTRDVQNRCYDDFLAEVSIINRLRHKNTAPLVGWSYNKGEPLLVFEFMTNGSLDQHLFPKKGNGGGGGSSSSSSSTDHRRTAATIRQWATRYEIVRDVATGLHYVHHEYEPMVLHCDIKASNVMLDSSFRARLGDFGLACTVAVDRNSATVFGGTRGYIAPEYAMSFNNKATRQTDIFAFGVLILEVVTGQRALIHQAADEEDVLITGRVWRLHREGRLLECVDSTVLASSSDDDGDGEGQLDTGGEAERLLLLGLACSNPNPSERPSMPEVMQVIAKSAPPPMVPLMKPTFVWLPAEGAACDGHDSAGSSMTTSNLDGSMSSTDERRSRLQARLGKPAAGGRATFQLEDSAVYFTAANAPGSSETKNRP